MKRQDHPYIAAMCGILSAIIDLCDRLCWKFQKRVLYPRFHIETPRYKRYWKKHCERLQHAIDNEQYERRYGALRTPEQEDYERYLWEKKYGDIYCGSF